MVVQEIRTARRTEPPLSGEIEALDEAEAELAEGKTKQLDDVLHHLSPRKKPIRGHAASGVIWTA
jgi:hypothetical protein